MRKLWIIALAVLVIGLIGSVLFRDRQPKWTTSSPEALAAFEQGLDARMSLYIEDAASFYSKAVELDPDFVAAKLGLLNSYYEKGEAREDLLRDLEAADLTDLTPREAFLVRYGLAKERGEPAAAQRILEEYLDRYPRDPFALSYFGEEAWQRIDLQEAERRFRRLLEVEPNWVMAQNRLGYLAMAGGRFDEAEDLFHTYKYIAPDQANPYDSLGELLILVGRYDEAREEGPRTSSHELSPILRRDSDVPGGALEGRDGGKSGGPLAGGSSRVHGEAGRFQFSPASNGAAHRP